MGILESHQILTLGSYRLVTSYILSLRQSFPNRKTLKAHAV